MLSFKSSDMQNISVKASTEWALTNQNGYGLQTTAVSYRYKPAVVSLPLSPEPPALLIPKSNPWDQQGTTSAGPLVLFMWHLAQVWT